MDETGWLIEFPGSPPCWWDGRGPETGNLLAEKGVRFSRKEDAERVLAWMVKREGAIVTEHGWAGVAAVLEAREAPDLAKEILAWLDDNVRRCGHGYIHITCGQCVAVFLSR